MKINNEYWLEGVAAFEAKKPRDDNPYVNTDNTHASIAWFGGYDMASIIILGDLSQAAH